MPTWLNPNHFVAPVHLLRGLRENLREVPENQVEVSYKSTITVIGRLTTFGDSIMRAKTKDLERKFTEALQERLAG